MRYLWLHGFASGPTSGKGRFIRERLRERGVELSIPDLNAPAFFDLTVTRMLGQLDALDAAAEGRPASIHAERDPGGRREYGDSPGADGLVLFGSSLGGFVAATWAASRPDRTRALVLLAPAFDLAPRWAARMGEAEVARWRSSGRAAFDHYALCRKEELSWAFLEDAARYDPYPLPRCPTLVIQGTQDDVVEPALAREFTKRMEGRAQLLELAQGHELNADLPALWREIDRFLRATLPGPPRST